MTTALSSRNIKRVPIGNCVPYADNPRRGDLDVIKDSLQQHGQFKPIVVRELDATSADPSYQILAGNHTWNAAKDLGWDEIAVCIIEADDEQAKKIVIVDNRTSDLGTYDDAQLVSLMKDLGIENLDGTGWTGEDFTELRRLTGDLAKEQSEGLEAALGERPDAPDTGDPVSPDDGPDEYRFNVNFACTAAQRTVVQRALNHIKEAESVPTSNEALVILAQTYIDEHMEAPDGAPDPE